MTRADHCVRCCRTVRRGAACVAVGADDEFSPGAAGIGDPYFPLDGNGGYDVQHYLLDVSYDPPTDLLTGVATIRADATQDLSQFNLDLDGLDVRSVLVDGVPAQWSRSGHELTVVPASGLPAGSRFHVVVRYDGVPQTIHDQFGQSGFIHTDDGALVVGQPHVAATWFPVNDHPRDKATYVFRITVPEGLEAVANGRLKERHTAGGRTTWTWGSRAMASYLATATIGEFELTSYRRGGIEFVDALDPDLLTPPATPRTGERFALSQAVDASVQATDPHDQRPGERRGPVVLGDPGHGAELGLHVRRGPHAGRGRLDDAARPQRAHQPEHRFVLPAVARAPSVPRALPDTP